MATVLKDNLADDNFALVDYNGGVYFFSPIGKYGTWGYLYATYEDCKARCNQILTVARRAVKKWGGPTHSGPSYTPTRTYLFVKEFLDKQWHILCLVINRKCDDYFVGSDVAWEIKRLIKEELYKRLELCT